MKHFVFAFTKIPFLKSLIHISRLIVEVLDDQNLFLQNRIWLIGFRVMSSFVQMANWFSNYVQFCSDGHFSERVEAAG